MKPHVDNSIRANKQRAYQSGFSMIELMIVLAIVGVIVAIAVPAYTSSVQASRRTDAKNALLDLASREEKYFSQNNQYTQSISSLYPGNTATGNTLNVESTSPVYYLLTVTSTTPFQTFSATAAPQSGTAQANDACGTYSIDNYGNTSVTGTATNCW